MAELVRAAGGVVWRMADDRAIDGVDDGVEVVLVHRPRQDDWTFPKGKVEPADVDEQHTALREVLEETGLRCTLGRELPSISYRDSRARPKRVRYWEMRVVDGGFAPNDEVDEMVWARLEVARASLSYDHDRTVLDAFAAFAAGSAGAA